MKIVAQIFFISAMCILSMSAKSQQRRLINYTEVSALIQNSTSLTDNSKFSGLRTRTGVTKLLDQHTGIGFALGTDNYRKGNGASYNTLPITLNASYYLNPDLIGLKVDIYGGYAVKLFNNLNKGLTAGAGLSYSLSVN